MPTHHYLLFINTVSGGGGDQRFHREGGKGDLHNITHRGHLTSLSALNVNLPLVPYIAKFVLYSSFKGPILYFQIFISF